MIKLFHKKAVPGKEEMPDAGQEEKSLSPETKQDKQEKLEKREYSFLFEFRCKGQMFAAVESGSIHNEVYKIGKNSNSDLVIPETDRICSDDHLELHLTAHGVRVVAVSGSYFYYNSRKNTAANLKVGDRISFGDCELNIKESFNTDDFSSKAHRLEFTNGAQKGEMVFLEKDLIKVGSDPENDIVLKEDVVSRFHAQIKVTENGECWLKDLHSINGTTVNDVKLGSQERLLMDSDEISFASVSMLFLDKRVQHTRSQIGRKFIIMGLTLVVISLIFAMFYAVTPHASQLLIAAEFYTARENFATAQKMLDKMPHAREYQKFKEHHQIFAEKLTRYRNTFTTWEEFKNNLKESRWTSAVESCGMLEEKNRYAWNWAEDSAEQKMQELAYAKMLLNHYFDLQSLLYTTVLTLEQKKEKIAQSRKIKFTDLKKELPWLLPLRKKIAENTKKLEESIGVWQKAEKLLVSLVEKENSSIRSIIGEMEKLYAASTGSVKARLFDINDTLKQLMENEKIIQENCKALVKMRFSGIRKSIAFVPRDECLINPCLTRKRSLLIARHRKILAIANSLAVQTAKLKSLGAEKGILPSDINKTLSAKEFEAIFDREILSSREIDQYERFFGKRYFFWLMTESVSSHENLYSDELLASMKKQPLCVKLNEIFKAAETSHLYLLTLKKGFLYKENIKAFDAVCVKILERKKSLIEFFRRKALQNKNKRGYFIAQTAVFYFSTHGSIHKNEMKTFAAKWKNYQIKMQDCYNEYDPLDSKKMQILRKKIQKFAIPGDPKMLIIWSLK